MADAMRAGAMDDPSTAQLGVEALRLSLTHVLEQLSVRDAELSEAKHSLTLSKTEASRLRRELNEAYAARGDKMK